MGFSYAVTEKEYYEINRLFLAKIRPKSQYGRRLKWYFSIIYAVLILTTLFTSFSWGLCAFYMATVVALFLFKKYYYFLVTKLALGNAKNRELVLQETQVNFDAEAITFEMPDQTITLKYDGLAAIYLSEHFLFICKVPAVATATIPVYRLEEAVVTGLLQVLEKKLVIQKIKG